LKVIWKTDTIDTMHLPLRRGVIDTVAAGFAITHRHFYLLVMPVLLDLFLWLGPKLSAEPLLTGLVVGAGGDVAPAAAGFGITEEMASVNVLALLTVVMPSAVDATVFTAERGPVLGTLTSWGQAALAVLALLAGGFAIGALYRAAAAQGVLRPAWNGRLFAQTLGAAAKRYGGLLLLVGLAAAAGLPAVSAVIAGLDSLSPVAGSLAALVVLGLLLWLVFLFWLADSAIFVGGLGPVAALRASATVVRSYFGPSLALFLIARIISLGLALVWSRMGESTIGLAAAIFANAYIATALTVAAMLFYRDRSYMLRWT
jgi:hypothetical protein